MVIACPLDDNTASHHVPGLLGVRRSGDEVSRGKGGTQCSSGQQKCLETPLPPRWGLSSAPDLHQSSGFVFQGQHLMVGLRTMVFAQHQQHQAQRLVAGGTAGTRGEAHGAGMLPPRLLAAR